MLSISPCVPLFLSASSALLIHGSGHAPLTQYVRACAVCTGHVGAGDRKDRARTAPIPAGPSSMNKDINGTPCTAAAGTTFHPIYHSTRSERRVTARDVCVSVRASLLTVCQTWVQICIRARACGSAPNATIVDQRIAGDLPPKREGAGGRESRRGRSKHFDWSVHVGGREGKRERGRPGEGWMRLYSKRTLEQVAVELTFSSLGMSICRM